MISVTWLSRWLRIHWCSSQSVSGTFFLLFSLLSDLEIGLKVTLPGGFNSNRVHFWVRWRVCNQPCDFCLIPDTFFRVHISRFCSFFCTDWLVLCIFDFHVIYLYLLSLMCTIALVFACSGSIPCILCVLT